MRILFCVPVPSFLAVHKKSTEAIPRNQFHWLWLKSFRKLKWQVTVFRYTDTIILPKKLIALVENFTNRHFPRFFARWRKFLSIVYDYRPLNYLRSLKLLWLIHIINPDAIFLVKGISELVLFPLIFAKRQKIPIIFFSGEDPKTAATSFERETAKLYSLIITNDPKHNSLWKSWGAKKVVTLPYAALDPSAHHRLPRIKKDLEVVFIGTLTSRRQNDARFLLNEQVNLKVFGYVPSLIGLHPDLKSVYEGEIWPHQSAKIYNRTKIALNFVENTPSGGNLRTFEIAGCGTFQLTEACLPEWFIPRKEIVTFENRHDLVKKIRYYLSRDKLRQQIAAAAYKRAHREHTYQKRFQAIQQLLK